MSVTWPYHMCRGRGHAPRRTRHYCFVLRPQAPYDQIAEERFCASCNTVQVLPVPGEGASCAELLGPDPWLTRSAS
jgi:hypothetical protein